MRKRVFAMLLSLIMGVSLLAGCEKKDEIVSQETEEEEVYVEPLDDNYRNFYEVFVYSFADSNGDGIGDMNGLKDKLSYIKDLGCNGIWLMPIMPSPTYHKYDVTDYMSLDPAYGTIEDFKAVIEEAHRLNIRVIIDFVINHSSSKHPWFLEATDYLKNLPEGDEADASVCPYVDYYHFSKEKSGNTWYKIPGSEYKYEGQFWSEMPDLNLSSEALRSELETAADYWIDLGVDGFRMDAPLHFEEGKTEYNCEVLNWLYEYCKAKNPEFYMVSEVWASEVTFAQYYSSLTPSMFNFDAGSTEGILLKTANGGSAEKLVNRMQKYEEDFTAQNKEAIDAPFLTNHDMSRVANVLQSNPDAMKFACGLLMISDGNPFIYYGEEIGMKSKGNKDENKRLAFPWSDTDPSMNCKGPSDADKGIEQTFGTLESQMEDPDSIYSYYRRALAMRNANPEIARGKITILEGTKEKQAFFEKDWNGSKVYIAVNSDKENQAEISTTSVGKELQVVTSLTSDNSDIAMNEGVLTMPSRSICVLRAVETE